MTDMKNYLQLMKICDLSFVSILAGGPGSYLSKVDLDIKLWYLTTSDFFERSKNNN